MVCCQRGVGRRATSDALEGGAGAGGEVHGVGLLASELPVAQPQAHHEAG